MDALTKAAAQMLLAKIYFNNQVYTGTAPAFSSPMVQLNGTKPLHFMTK